ncbi:MAG: hypothetical protein U1F22_13430 [Lysobacterales bacterium]
MSLPRGIRYFGGGDLSGYGIAAVRAVRLLVNAGLPVQWIPLRWHAPGMLPAPWEDAAGRRLPLLQAQGGGAAYADVPELIRATAAPVGHDTVIVHAPPDTWPAMFEAGRRNIGYVAWETDCAPAHWLPLLRLAERIAVPSQACAQALQRAGLAYPPQVVPHPRAPRAAEYSPGDIAAARSDLGIPPGHTVFYSIGRWDPRKNLAGLIDAFVRAFDADDPVTLLLKTDTQGSGTGPWYAPRATRELAADALAAALARHGRSAPHLCLIDERLDGDGIDLLHALGDVYVSLSHGEGWGCDALEAAVRATPVIGPGWGGPLDYLGARWPGAVPGRLVPAPVWPPQCPLFFPSQRWAEPDLDAAARLLRAHWRDPAPARAAAQAIRERVVQRYGEARVWHDWRALLA